MPRGRDVEANRARLVHGQPPTGKAAYIWGVGGGYKVKCPQCGLSTAVMPRAEAIKRADRHTFAECKVARTKPATKEKQGLGLVDRTSHTPKPARPKPDKPA
jgi:hypothetical protein